MTDVDADTSAWNGQVSTKPPMPEPFAVHVGEMQQRLRSGAFTLDDMPGYVPGEPPSIETWHHMDYLDIYPKVWGRE
ncbi:MAG TPA: hypothetical protein VID47_14060, partial [Actinomycetota bacterium]